MAITVKELKLALEDWEDDAMVGAFISDGEGYEGWAVLSVDAPDKSGMCRLFLNAETDWAG